MTEIRIGQDEAISGFVVADDRSARARLAAFHRRVRWFAMRRAVPLRRVSRRIGHQASQLTACLAHPSLRLAQGRTKEWLASIWTLVALIGLLLSRLVRTGTHPRSSSSRLPNLALLVVTMAFAAALLLPDRSGLDAGGEIASGPQAPLALVAAPPATAEPAREAALQASLGPDLTPWQPVRRPIALFHLESPDVEGRDLVYRAATRGGSRQDVLSWTPRPESTGRLRRTMAHLVIERDLEAGRTEKPLFAELASRTAEQHLSIDRMARPSEILTKFGGMEAAEVTLRGDERSMACLGFRRIDMAGLTFAGWVCGTPEHPVDRVALSCFVDRLDLVGGGRDGVLRKIFADAERARARCASARQSGKRLTWLDHEAPLPGLKLSQRKP